MLLSKKHGVNPAIPHCFFCNQPKNELILAGRLRDDAEAPKSMVWDKEPCDKCKEYMKQGIILVSVDEKKSQGDMENPWRTGGWWVVSEDYIERVFGTAAPEILKKRAAFIEHSTAEALGLFAQIKEE